MQLIECSEEPLSEVAPLRQSSREVVRELGMLEDTYAPASITHTQCHALMELEGAGTLSVGELAERLQLDKSSMSRAVANLSQRRIVTIKPDPNDGRRRQLGLTAAGRKLVARVHASANARVQQALSVLDPSQRARVVEGLEIYARALRRARVIGRMTVRPIKPADDPEIAKIIRAVMTEHGAVGAGFAIVDPEVANMSAAYDPDTVPKARYFVVEDGGAVIGGAGFAALHSGPPGTCELRKMYLLPSARGAGLGRRLLALCLDAARDAGYERCYLETMGTMHRARALYESVGFERVDGPQGATGHYGCDAFYARRLVDDGGRPV